MVPLSLTSNGRQLSGAVVCLALFTTALTGTAASHAASPTATLTQNLEIRSKRGLRPIAGAVRR